MSKFGEWESIETAPMDGTSIIVCDAFGVMTAAYDQPMSLEMFKEICEDGEGEDEWIEYLEENPALGWLSFDDLTGDQVMLQPIFWMPMPEFPGEKIKALIEAAA